MYTRSKFFHETHKSECTQYRSTFHETHKLEVRNIEILSMRLDVRNIKVFTGDVGIWMYKVPNFPHEAYKSRFTQYRKLFMRRTNPGTRRVEVLFMRYIDWKSVIPKFFS